MLNSKYGVLYRTCSSKMWIRHFFVAPFWLRLTGRSKICACWCNIDTAHGVNVTSELPLHVVFSTILKVDFNVSFVFLFCLPLIVICIQPNCIIVNVMLKKVEFYTADVTWIFGVTYKPCFIFMCISFSHDKPLTNLLFITNYKISFEIKTPFTRPGKG